MEWYIKLPLAILGIVELVIRACVVLVLCVFIVGLVMFIESGQTLTELLTPWCFKHIQAADSKKKSGEIRLSLRQRRKLEYMRQEQQILEQRKGTLVDIQRLEGEIGSAFRPLA